MLVGAWLSAAAAPAAPPPAPAQSVVVSAASSHVDYRTDTATFKDIVVTQGGTRVTAERCQATGLGFNSSTWTFEGNVIISMQPQATLRSNRAIVEIRAGRVTGATVTGTPATFEAQRTGSQPAVNGQADNVVYDASEDTVRLSGEAWVSGGQNERMSGPLLIYRIRDDRLLGISPRGTQQVHITVVTPQTLQTSGQRAQHPRSRRRANSRSGDHHRNLPTSSSHSPDSGR